MKIAITMRRIIDEKYGEERDAISNDWIKFMNSISSDIKIIPINNNPNRTIDIANEINYDGLILSNGNSWDECKDRDETEIKLIKWFREKKKPILGICRGFHVINLVLGGKLETKINKYSSNSHSGNSHKIIIIDEHFLSIAEKSEITVNSYHNQGIILSGLSKNLTPIAISEKIIVEAYYHNSEPILALQWHPEREGGPNEFNKKIILDLFKNNNKWKLMI